MTGLQAPSWAPKVSRVKIQRLYTSDANGIIDEGLIDEVGWDLWSRCDSILAATAAHYGRVTCPTCTAVIISERQNLIEKFYLAWKDEDILQCRNCNWRLPWKAYHQTYRGKQLFGANAVEIFEAFHKAFPKTTAPNAKMLLIDQLIHAFHTGLTGLGRPVGANLIQGSLKEVILFLDGLTNGPASAAGIGSSHADWRRKLEGISWARPWIQPNGDRDRAE